MFLEQYISSINNTELKQTIGTTSTSFLQKMNRYLTNSQPLNALLLGNVQSGKTAQMLGIIAAMADNGYKFFLLMTVDNVDLYRQTYNRVKESLAGFNVLNEKEDILLTPVTLAKPTVVVIKKNARVLSRWKNQILNTACCLG